MGECRLLLLGPPQPITGGGTAQITLRKAIALLAYLAVEQRSFSREYLAALLWPDLGQSDSLANLRRTLSVLRSSLHPDCLLAEGDHVTLNADLVEVDVHDFRRLSARTPGEPNMEDLEEALDLYRASFMEGFNLGKCEEFDQWQDSVRERLQAEFDSVLERLCSSRLERNEPERAMPIARRWLELDSLNESAHQTLMRIFAQLGRPDLARRQYESCVQILQAEGIEPDETTHELHDSIVHDRARSRRNRPEPEPAPPASAPAPLASDPASWGPGAARDTRHRRWLLPAAKILGAAIAVVVVTITVIKFELLLVGYDVRVADVVALTNNQGLAGVRFALQNAGAPARRVGYSVVLVSDGSIGTDHEYEVQTGETKLGRNSETLIELDRDDIRHYVDGHGIPVPPGTYSVAVIADRENRLGESSEFNNRADSREQFHFEGGSGVPYIEVEIRYGATAPLDERNSLEVFFGDRTPFSNPDEWGRFRITGEGTFFFPVEDIPRKDVDGTGYFMMLLYDAGDNREHPSYADPTEVPALYKEVPGNLVYGGFNVAGGTALFPGESYRVRYAPAPTPGPDEFELDDAEELATFIEYDALPVRQYHTFHDDGTGDADWDWFQIHVREGETLTVETSSADGLWEADTAIDLSDSEMNYLGTTMDKSSSDSYTLLTYRNDTGTDQDFHLLIKPFRRSGDGHFIYGEYIVEFRR